MMKKSTSLLSVAICLLFAGALFAQSDLGNISGFVKDPSGAAVPRAKVTVRNQSGLERTVETNETGRYTITTVPPGVYSVKVEAQGFRTFTSAGNKLDPTANLVVDAALQVGATSETVEVTDTAQQLQTESATVQKVITRQQIDALELNGRNPIFMANLLPGMRGGNLSGLSFNFSQGPNNINGARTQESLITFDGAPAVRTRSNGTSLGSADLDSTQEIQILTADYAAEYGRSSGGQIRITSKSGTQQFHGAAYEYVRNTIFNANSWTRNNNTSTDPLTRTAGITAPIHYNQFGYNIGGPLWIPNHFNTNKDKVFWYWGEEWVRYVFTDSNSMTVPTLAMRRGDFSELLNPSNIFYKKAVVIKDPNTGSPYPNNIIPAPGSGGTFTNASANGLGILNAWPAPNLTTPISGNKNWYFSAKHPQHQRKDTIAIDVNFTENQHLRLRRNYYSFWEYQPLDGGTNETPKFFERPNQTNSIDYTWVVNPRMVNELLITGSQDVVRIPVDAAHFLDRTKGAVQGPGYFGTNYQYIFNDGTKLLPNRIPSVNATNFSGLSGGPYPSHSAGPIIDVGDSFTWVKQNHTLKFGVLYEYQGENDNDEINVSACSTCTNNQNGQFQFLDSRAGGTGVAVANMALGLFDRYSEIGHRAYTVFRAPMWEGFAQDSWKVTPKLTLNGGLRYTVIQPYHARWGNMAVFDPKLYDPSKAFPVCTSPTPTVSCVSPSNGLILGPTPSIDQQYNGMAIPGSGFPSSAKDHVPEANTTTYNGLFKGLPNYYSNIQWNNIQPRLGLAYQLTPKTVFRAGIGRFYTRLGVSDSVFLGGNPPFQPSASLTNGAVDTIASTKATIPLVVTTQTKNFRNPEAWNWNVTVERELPWNLVTTLAYVGRRGIHQQREADINQPTIATVLANPGVNIDALRPFKGYGTIRQTDNIASSKYNSLQAMLNRRFANGLLFGVSYTLSKSMDDGSNQRDVVPDTYDTSMMWGPSEFDVRHILIANWLYDLPFFRGQHGFLGNVLGGWQISGIAQFQTGTPCNVAANVDYAGVGQDANYGCQSGQFWAVNGSPQYVKTFGTTGQWFSTKNADGSAIFTAPAKGTFVTQHVRDLIYNPGFQNWNMGLFKRIQAGERVNFQFRAEAFDVFNHPNWNGADFNPTSGTFGKVTGKNSERNLQLSLRMEF